MTHAIDGPLSNRTATAAVWLVSVRLLTKLIDFIALLVLARLLTPADFGLVAIAMTLIFIVEAVLELPINQALVRQPTITRSQLDTAFTLGLLRGLLLAIFLVAVSYPFAIIYDDRRLTGLILALGWAPILRGLLSPKLAEYARQIDFRRDFFIDLTGKLVSLAIAIAVAWQTRSYWALVLGTVTTPLVMAITSYVLAPYKPRLTLHDWPIFSSFTGWSTITQLLAALSWQSDRLILGHFASRQQLGVFALANDLAYIPELALIKPIVRPLMAAFAHANTAAERLRHAYQRASLMLLTVGAPVMLGLCLLADPIVRLMLGGKWLAAIPILQFLPLSLIPPLLAAPFWSLAMAVGRPQLVMRQTLIDLILRGSALMIGAVLAGVEGVIAGRIIAAGLSMIATAWYVRSITGASMIHQFAATWRTVAAGALMSGVVWLVRPLTEQKSGIDLALALGVTVAAGGLVYLSALLVTWRLAKMPDGLESWLIARLRSLRPGARQPT